jgi:sterol desaturase/sphingolipid hydroxylase (fatty acid hydroxylase superfamily)
MNVNPIVIAIPVYFLLIGIEIIYQRIQAVKTYRLKDAMTNINCGVISQISGAFIMVILFGMYTYVQQNWSPFYIPVVWWAFPLAFVFFDFMYYWAHRLSHEVNLFWGGHSVHHQSEEYNLSVALRQSSTQILWTFLFYLPLAMAGIDPIVFISMQGINLVYQFWIHTEAIQKMPAWYEAVFNTPSHHRVHHARNPRYIDKNHAGTLIIWDRLFGTFAAEEEKPDYGITKPLKSWNPLWANFAHYVDIYHDVKKVSGLKDKLRVLVKKPGWLPQSMGGYRAPKEVSSDYQKFDNKTPMRLNLYVIVQFLIVIIGTLSFLYYLNAMPGTTRVLSAAIIVLSVATFGLLFENRKWVNVIEYLRLVAAALMTVYAVAGFHPGLELILLVTTGLVISAGWFASINKQLKQVQTIS